MRRRGSPRRPCGAKTDSAHASAIADDISAAVVSTRDPALTAQAVRVTVVSRPCCECGGLRLVLYREHCTQMVMTITVRPAIDLSRAAAFQGVPA